MLLYVSTVHREAFYGGPSPTRLVEQRSVWLVLHLLADPRSLRRVRVLPCQGPCIHRTREFSGVHNTSHVYITSYQRPIRKISGLSVFILRRTYCKPECLICTFQQVRLLPVTASVSSVSKCLDITHQIKYFASKSFNAYHHFRFVLYMHRMTTSLICHTDIQVREPRLHYFNHSLSVHLSIPLPENGQ